MNLDEFLQLDYVVNLKEVFDTKIPVDAWESVDGALRGTLEIDGETFVVLLQPGKYPAPHYTYSFINVAFEKLVDGKFTRDIQLDSSNASKIIGAVKNALLEKISEFDFDAITFAATDAVDKRMRVYNTIVRDVSKQIGPYIPDVKADGSRITVLVNKTSPAADHMGELVEHLKQVEK